MGDPLLRALDTDRDGALSAAEIAGAGERARHLRRQRRRAAVERRVPSAPGAGDGREGAADEARAGVRLAAVAAASSLSGTAVAGVARPRLRLALRRRDGHVAGHPGAGALRAAAGREAEQAILDEIARESKILSGYDPASEFSRWMPAPASTDESLAGADRSAGRLRRLAWAHRGRARPGRRSGRPGRGSRPPPRIGCHGAESCRRRCAQVQQRHWIVDRAASTATRTSDAPLRLNSFTKSYIVDRAARRALAVRGVQRRADQRRRRRRRARRLDADRRRRGSGGQRRQRRAARRARGARRGGRDQRRRQARLRHRRAPLLARRRSAHRASRPARCSSATVVSRRCDRSRRAGDGVLRADAGRKRGAGAHACPVSRTRSSSRTDGRSRAPAGGSSTRGRARGRPWASAVATLYAAEQATGARPGS